jgi:Integrase core domain
MYCSKKRHDRASHISKPIGPRSPWQNPYVERLIGTIRRECLDHMIVFGEAHLRRILGRYAAYYNEPGEAMPGMDNSPLFDSFNFLTIRGSAPKWQKGVQRIWPAQHVRPLWAPV